MLKISCLVDLYTLSTPFLRGHWKIILVVKCLNKIVEKNAAL